MSESRLREQICLFARSMFERGLTHGSSGNISAVLDDGGLLMTPTDASLGFLDPARLARFDAQGRFVDGDKPTKEAPLHKALYESRIGSGAVVHLHSTHAVAISMLPGLDPASVLPPLTPYYVMRVGDTALIPYHRPGDPAVADAIRGLAGRYASILLANHGPVVAGTSLTAAVNAIEELEETARLHLLLRHLDPRVLSADQVADLGRTFGTPSPSDARDPHQH
ncbi:aldolase [Luteibacter rhizovicinus DSM 16549]|uniref:3-oxo-tetronate 4-phosphate decarboxylase n=1 Tax=Luteibacter rhizovicinus DSM 16549 TaxID=1440763 RepID=A0A0G9HGE5_9GAMM|nr:aldolase [Luteibacter rhizovicinus]APG03619.1 aldolase [Luteibacter rhizovicinus DSM 16549]KLD68783.1 aldolase [Luteibacter rhizovicinus DSM 16549]KLD73137.1 aldolase [Xanthomonas hyacinthi DSM 19077]